MEVMTKLCTSLGITGLAFVIAVAVTSLVGHLDKQSSQRETKFLLPADPDPPNNRGRKRKLVNLFLDTPGNKIEEQRSLFQVTNGSSTELSLEWTGGGRRKLAPNRCLNFNPQVGTTTEVQLFRKKERTGGRSENPVSFTLDRGEAWDVFQAASPPFTLVYVSARELNQKGIPGPKTTLVCTADQRCVITENNALVSPNSSSQIILPTSPNKKLKLILYEKKKNELK